MEKNRSTRKLNFLNHVVCFVLKSYQKYLSPCFPRACRFYPTCSEYAKQCFEKHPFWKASILTAYRLGRCHPLGEGGIDKIPSVGTKPAVPVRE